MDLFEGKSFASLLEERCALMYGISGRECNREQIYKAVATVINLMLRAKRREYNALVRVNL